MHAHSGQDTLFEIHRVQAGRVAPAGTSRQSAKRSRSQRSTKTRPLPFDRVERQRQAALDVLERRTRGSGRRPPALPSSRFPCASGTSDTTAAPQANAASTDRQSHASCSSAGTKGGEISRKTRSATPRSPSARGGVCKSADREPLVQLLERHRMRRLESHRHLEPQPSGRRRRGGHRAPTAADRRAAPTSDGCDSTMTCDRPVSAFGTAS